MIQVKGYMQHMYMNMLRPDSQPLTRFEAGQHIQFQSRSDKLAACCVDRVGA